MKQRQCYVYISKKYIFDWKDILILNREHIYRSYDRVMYISKKYTFYQKDLLVLVRTNLVYLMVEWKRMNLIDRDISLFLFILEQINLQKCVVLCGILIKSYIFHVPYILFLSSPLKMRKSKVTCLRNYCFLQFQTPK